MKTKLFKSKIYASLKGSKRVLAWTIFSLGVSTNLWSQPTLQSADLVTGQSFDLFTLTNVSGSQLSPAGANVTWNLSSATATPLGTADFLDMSNTPYQSQYPAANFAMKFTVGGSSVYSLFNLTPTVLEEVANNVGTGNATSFLDYRTALVFPFTFNLSNTDSYQKSGQSVNTIINNYDAYGTAITGTVSTNNLVRDFSTDNGTGGSQGIWWNVSPMHPVLQADNSGVTLWQPSVANNINQINAGSSFRVYPNPAANELRVINLKPITKIEIYNATGQLQITATESVIDISALPAGIYFVKAFLENGIETIKVNKQ